MTIIVTGATGQLGRLAIEALLRRGVPASDIVAVGRQVEKIADLGVTVRAATYDDEAALETAFAGGDRLLFISGSEVGKRLTQHRNVIDAAKAAGIAHVFYTSAPKADHTDMKLADEHLATEQWLLESGLPTTFLRNNWYLENYNLPATVENGLFGAARDGRISITPRSELAEGAAAAVLLDNPKRVYELGGHPVTLAEFAAEISRATGQEVTYTDLPAEKYAEVLIGVGLAPEHAAVLADSDRAASGGALDVSADDLEELLGRPVKPLGEAIKEALAG